MPQQSRKAKNRECTAESLLRVSSVATPARGAGFRELPGLLGAEHTSELSSVAPRGGKSGMQRILRSDRTYYQV